MRRTERGVSLETLLGKLIQALLDRVERFPGIDSFGGDENLCSLTDVRRHDIHDADSGTFFAIHENCYLALEAHRTTHKFAHWSRVQSTFVRDQELASLCFFGGLIHGSI